ncbi:hypothetical protein CAPTEDRAFT_204975 [Capitella teleta]|uniref:Uncharacterized protein n=1 Tax=Capitella teleta TaxID=283909 RepID=R7T7L3_CAPTE|nr:hypothetical protein CAPTEDRAFT_204975 [Capitella teleta]|eukprot:ELT89600.1 hypothetical protein CAPTEDRAFT_204975 [Capitella teleta]
MATKLYGKDASKYDDIDLDELLSKLTEEELVELETDLIDPDAVYGGIYQFTAVFTSLWHVPCRKQVSGCRKPNPEQKMIEFKKFLQTPGLRDILHQEIDISSGCTLANLQTQCKEQPRDCEL